MDKQKIIDKIKKEKTQIPRFLLKDGSFVVDTTVDENNQLYYVIKNKNEYTVTKAEGIIPMENLIKNKKKRVIVNNGVIEKIEEID